MFKIFTDRHIKTYQSLKGRAILKITIPFFRTYALPVGLKIKPLRNVFSSVMTKTNSNFVVKRAERSNHSFLLSIWWFDGRLFGRNPLKWGKICLKFWPVMECNIMHQVCGVFYVFFSEKTPEIEPKNNFLAHFDRFLVYVFLCLMSYTPIVCQI